MRVTRIVFCLGIAALLVASLLLVWLYVPSLRRHSSHTFTPEQLALDSGEPRQEAWISKLDAPRWIHLGDSGTLRLTISPNSSTLQPNLPTAALSGHTVLVEARAEIPAAGASPSGLSSQAIAPGQPAEFEWRITPQGESVLEGRVWVYLRVVTENGAEATRRPLTVQPVVIRSDTLFGRVADQVRQSALIALMVGFVLVLPYLLMRSHARRARGPAPDLDPQL